MPQGHISIHRETNLQLSSMRVLAIGKKQTNKQTNSNYQITITWIQNILNVLNWTKLLATRCLRLVKKSSSVPLLFSALITRVNTFNHNVWQFMLINELILAMSEARVFIVNISNAHATVCYFLHEVQFVCF
jgi:hypothetical protein